MQLLLSLPIIRPRYVSSFMITITTPNTTTARIAYHTIPISTFHCQWRPRRYIWWQWWESILVVIAKCPSWLWSWIDRLCLYQGVSALVVIIEEPSWTSLTMKSVNRDSVIGNPGRCRIRCRDCDHKSMQTLLDKDKDGQSKITIKTGTSRLRLRCFLITVIRYITSDDHGHMRGNRGRTSLVWYEVRKLGPWEICM
jgi:hypothetical protein